MSDILNDVIRLKDILAHNNPDNVDIEDLTAGILASMIVDNQMEFNQREGAEPTTEADDIEGLEWYVNEQMPEYLLPLTIKEYKSRWLLI